MSIAPESDGELAAMRKSIEHVLEDLCDRRTVHSFVDGKNDLEDTLYRTAADLGWLGLACSEEWGGHGIGQQGLDILYRQLGRCLAPGSFIATLSAARWIAEFTCDSEATRYLPRLLAGHLQVAVPASDAAEEALCVANGRVRGHSDLLLGSDRCGLAIVPVPGGMAVVETTASGATLHERRGWDLTRRLAVLHCDDVEPVVIVPDPDKAARRRLQDQVSLAVAGDSIGGMTAIIDQTVEYLRTRVQFGKPIGSFQALKHRAADLVILRDMAEGLVDHAVFAAAADSQDAAMWIAIAKAKATDAFVRVAEDCMLLHGGIGVTWEYDCHLFLKRARLNEALVAAGPHQYDSAAAGLFAAARAGRSTTEVWQ